MRMQWWFKLMMMMMRNLEVVDVDTDFECDGLRYVDFDADFDEDPLLLMDDRTLSALCR